MQALSEAHGLRNINTNWAQYPHTTDSAILLHIFQERLGREPEADELHEFKSCFVRLLKERYHSGAESFGEIAGAGRAFARLRSEPEWAVALATGCWRESAVMKLEAARIAFDGVPAAFAEDGLSREEILRTAISKALGQYEQKEFSKIVSIGDGLWDVRAAALSGLTFIGIGSDARAERLRLAGAQEVIADLADYEGFLRSLSRAQIPRTGG